MNYTQGFGKDMNQPITACRRQHGWSAARSGDIGGGSRGCIVGQGVASDQRGRGLVPRPSEQRVKEDASAFLVRSVPSDVPLTSRKSLQHGLASINRTQPQGPGYPPLWSHVSQLRVIWRGRGRVWFLRTAVPQPLGATTLCKWEPCSFKYKDRTCDGVG